ncbi:uncharacterized protein LOC121367429 isoform X2 [Gigantopelta aegis]|nr:uncharacterized protein LOC121367429 isoform X2 [Gigantopelta aegis]XP_041347530.1 uncharacterized protein LOC121367429 isoform X2 [Gigantopelta aegis]
MLSLATGGSHDKAEWWPENASLEQVPDSQISNENDSGSVDALRQIVTKCYQYLGRADLLKPEHKPEMDESCQLETCESNRIEENEEHAQAVDELMDLEVEEIVESDASDSSDDEIVIYSEESDIDEINLEVQTTTTGPMYLIGNSKNFKSHFEVKTNPPKPKLLGPKCARRLSAVQQASTKLHTSPVLHPSTVPRTLTKIEFLNTLGLKTTSQHERDEMVIKKEVNINCDVLSVDEFDQHQICSPRSSRTLISQMSRDLENCPRKRLSFSALEYGHCEGDQLEDCTSQIQGCLLRIPFSSHLGMRLKKHMRGENTLNIIYNPAEYCGTAPRPEFTDKLRIRPQDFPVTFKRRKRGIPKHSHEIKFSKADKKKFLIRVKTGLTERSRRLKRLMKNCKVVLNRVTDDEIKQWAKPMFHDNTVWTIDDDISIVAVDIPMSNINRQSTQQQQSLSRVYRPPLGRTMLNPAVMKPVLGNVLADRRMQCLMSEPRPCFLVKKVEKQFNANNGDTSSKMVYVPVSQHISMPVSKAESLVARSENENAPIGLNQVQGSNRRKQNFQVRQDLDDDGISHRKLHGNHEAENKINLLKNKLQSDTFQPYQSTLPKSYEKLQSALKNVLVKTSGAVQGINHMNGDHSVLSAASTCQNNSRTMSPSDRTSHINHLAAEVDDDLPNESSHSLKISSVYSLKTSPSTIIRKELGRIGCISSSIDDDHDWPQKVVKGDQCKASVVSNSSVKLSNCTSPVLPIIDKRPVSDDDDDDCICVGEIITIDDDD